MADPVALRDAALELVDATDPIALRGFAASRAEHKADGSPVTAADREVEATLRRGVAARFPDHAVLGEEDGGAVDPSRPTWVIDPIDGTRNYVRGVPIFATLIAVVVDERVVAGVASAPALGERWDAAAGSGARRNGRRLAVSDVDELGRASVCHGGLDWFREVPGAWERLGAIADRVERTRGLGDFWMHLQVAAGAVDAAFERDLSVWDVAALVPIVEEAGGRVTSWDGGDPLAGDGSLLTSNGNLHATLTDLLSGWTRP